MDLTTADESEDTLHVECVCERAATAARAITRKRGERVRHSPSRGGGGGGPRGRKCAGASARLLLLIIPLLLVSCTMMQTDTAIDFAYLSMMDD